MDFKQEEPKSDGKVDGTKIAELGVEIHQTSKFGES
jgi:hypothetical protein